MTESAARQIADAVLGGPACPCGEQEENGGGRTAR